MSMRQRRIVSAMTSEAREKRERLEAEGRDPLTGRPVCEGTDCACEQKHGGAGGAPDGGASGGGRSRRRGSSPDGGAGFGGDAPGGGAGGGPGEGEGGA